MINNTDVAACHTHPICKRISWSAIFAGAIVAIGLSFLLNLLAVALGLSIFTANEEGSMIIAIGGIVGILIGIIVVMMLAGFTAGCLGRGYCPERNMGLLYGFGTWTVTLIISAIIGTHVNNYATTYSSSLSPAVVMEGSTNTTVKSVKVSNTNNENNTKNSTKMVVMKANANNMAWMAFSVFALFLIGAISACIGGHCGMCCKKEHCN